MVKRKRDREDTRKRVECKKKSKLPSQLYYRRLTSFR